jgi:hypothetical protein
MRSPSFTTSFADLQFKYFSVGPDILIYGIANIARFLIRRMEKIRKNQVFICDERPLYLLIDGKTTFSLFSK